MNSLSNDRRTSSINPEGTQRIEMTKLVVASQDLESDDESIPLPLQHADTEMGRKPIASGQEGRLERQDSYRRTSFPPPLPC